MIRLLWGGNGPPCPPAEYGPAESLEKLAIGLLFNHEELRRGNCTKPVRDDVQQLDSERLWAIKCMIVMQFTFTLPAFVLFPYQAILTSYTPHDGSICEKSETARWSTILTKTLNAKCRQLRKYEHSPFRNFSKNIRIRLRECLRKNVAQACLIRARILLTLLRAKFPVSRAIARIRANKFAIVRGGI